MSSLRAILLLLAVLLFAAPRESVPFGGPGAKGYAGSEACGECHEAVYAQWRLTPHANMLRDSRKNPEAVAARNFNESIPFRREDIHWMIGSHWIQKYITFLDNDYYVLPKYWNLVADDWEPYSIFNWRERPYTTFCDGCHTTGFDPETKSFHEPSIGCEACHGPGEKHVRSNEAADIVNPAKLPKERRDMICEACHTDGKDTRYGGEYPFPAGYRPGEDLGDYYTDFFAPKPKSKKWYWGTMDYRERHRMFLFWQSKFYSTTRACDVCGFDRGITVKEERYMTRDEYCGTCHGKIWKTGAAHTRHAPDQVGCVDCHIPATVDGGERYSIHDHKFDFSSPEHPCTECHEEKKAAGKTAENHTFHFSRVKVSGPRTMKQACARCHPDKDVGRILADWSRGAGRK